MKNLSQAPRKGRVIDFNRAKEIQEIELKRPVPNNDHLYKRTQLLFKNRRKNIENYKKSSSRDPPSPLPTSIPAPRYPPSEVLGKHLCHYEPDTYRPPVQSLTSDNPSTFRASKSKSKSICVPVSAAEPEKLNLNWPPPSDSNYFNKPTVPSNNPPISQESPINIPVIEPRGTGSKFVDCEKCGKKKFSSIKQLEKHQASKKCKNRQDRNKIHRCEVCRVKFDTSHNLRKHICRT